MREWHQFAQQCVNRIQLSGECVILAFFLLIQPVWLIRIRRKADSKMILQNTRAFNFCFSKLVNPNELPHRLAYVPDIVVSLEGLPRHCWLQFRRTGLGGSDAAKVMFVCPFGTRRDLYYLFWRRPATGGYTRGWPRGRNSYPQCCRYQWNTNANTLLRLSENCWRMLRP